MAKRITSLLLVVLLLAGVVPTALAGAAPRRMKLLHWNQRTQSRKSPKRRQRRRQRRNLQHQR